MSLPVGAKYLSFATFVICLGASSLSAAGGETYRFTNQESWEVPQATLPPGEYVLAVQDKLLDREIFQVKGAKDGKLYSTFLAVPQHGGDGKNTLTFWSKTSDVTPVRAWFIPSDAHSWEFVYPKERAVEIAKGTGHSVPAVDLSSVANTTNRFLSDSDLRAVQLWMLTPKRVGTGDVQIAAAKIKGSNERLLASNTKPASAAASETGRMPHTASNYLASLLGGMLLMLAGAFALLRARQA